MHVFKGSCRKEIVFCTSVRLKSTDISDMTILTLVLFLQGISANPVKAFFFLIKVLHRVEQIIVLVGA